MASYTLDTCAMIEVYEHPSVGGLMACRLDSSTSNFYVCSMTMTELENKNYDSYDVVARVQQHLGAKIIVGDVSPQVSENAEILSSACPCLHCGDKEILSFAISKRSTLVTADKGLIECCRKVGAKAINLHGLATHNIKKKHIKAAFFGRVSRYARAVPKENLWNYYTQTRAN